MVLRLALIALTVCLAPLPVYADDFQDDLKARRQRVMETMGPESMLIVFSAPLRNFSRDVDYEYRQDSNFYYLTGIDQPDSTLVLMPGNAVRKEILFTTPGNPAREHFAGRLLSSSEATERSGIETVYPSTRFERFVSAMLYGRPFGPDIYGPFSIPEFTTFFEGLRAGRARLWLVLEPKPLLSDPLPPVYEFANQVRERVFNITLQDATGVLHDLRRIKTSYEQEILQRSMEILTAAHLAGMRVAGPNVFEFEVKAAIERVYRSEGALGWGFPTIVGSGPNATILHYPDSSRRMEPGDLLLVDAGANYQYMTGDVTRTYPVDGRFTGPQKDIYNLVLGAQDAAVRLVEDRLASGGQIGLKEVHEKTEEVIAAGLLELGLVTDAGAENEQLRRWYTHGSVHYIGIDVHDAGNPDSPLEPGVAFVIEPGVYVREEVLESLANNPDEAAFVESVRPAVDKYLNIGVRIEDSFLVTDSGLRRLSSEIPRTIDDIERFLRGTGVGR